MVLRPWQRADIKKIYDNPAGTRRAIISFGRKNGKTALAAFLLLLHLCGPEALENSELYSAAQSREQAGILFSLAAKTVRASPKLEPFITIRDTRKELFCPGRGTLYRALSAEVKTSYGLSPVFVVHDELGQVKGPRSPLYEALETATGAQEAPLSIIISTQAPTEADLLSVLLDDAIAGHDPRVIYSLYTADMDADPFDAWTIRQANPAFGDFQNAAEVLAMAEDARRTPSLEASYRNLILNQRVEASAPFVSRGVWAANNAKPKPLAGVPVYGGLDLSETADLTALVLIGLVDEIWQIHPTFWLPGDGLKAKADHDRVPYDLWHREGYLLAAPGKSVDYEYVAEYLTGVFDAFDIKKIAFDRWNFRHLRPWLLKVGFTEAMIEKHFEEFGQGMKSMSPALRVLEADLLNGRMAHGDHPVLRMCSRNAVIDTDPAGNRKLIKDPKKLSGRVDGMISLAMARGAAAADAEKTFNIRALIG
jgi:phage terminase large subunit-like protein